MIFNKLFNFVAYKWLENGTSWQSKRCFSFKYQLLIHFFPYKCSFLDVVCRWPGATHDSMIFENCGLKVGFQISL